MEISMEILQIGFIGFGLIGGSIAKALRAYRPQCHMIATSRSLSPLYQAQKDGVLDEITDCVNEQFSGCDIIFICTPVVTITKYFELLKPLIKSSCILTDVGSVKESIYSAAKNAGLENNFIGGHPMAAGLSLPKENVEKFRTFLNEHTTLTEEDFIPKITIDVPMPIGYITEHLIEELSALEPFGKGNEKPLFAEKNLNILSMRILGKNRNTLKMQVRSQHGTVMDALYFGDIEQILTYIMQKHGESETEKCFQGQENAVTLSFIYYPSVNEYRGRKSLQMIISHYC